MFELVWDFLQADPRQGFECRWSKKEARIEHREEMAGSQQRVFSQEQWWVTGA